MLASNPLNKLVPWLDLAISAASMLLLLCLHGGGEFEVAMGSVLLGSASRGRRLLLPTVDWVKRSCPVRGIGSMLIVWVEKPHLWLTWKGITLGKRLMGEERITYDR